MEKFKKHQHEAELTTEQTRSSIARWLPQRIRPRWRLVGKDSSSIDSALFAEYEEYVKRLAGEMMEVLDDEDRQMADVKFYINDIRALALEFRRCLNATAELDLYPCVVIADDLVPVNILNNGMVFRSFQQLVDAYGINLGRQHRELTDVGQVEFVSNAEARASFYSVLISFIGGRVGNHLQRHPPTSRCGSGVHLTIDTDTKGLEIHFTPSCFIGWKYFGSPTGPVDDCIHAGYYHFRAIEWNPVKGEYVKRYETTAPRYVGGTKEMITFPV